ncbi:hypothetical protein [Flavobacterium sp. LHD-85]|uniref:hypothetical protein n=1 Tax=Flavobacterium sp. LHD-85 TaxID=3071410 RepID=UPI0027DFB6ED|nr:hypothetical protein [Flavobacterium sp. LHD-85]MDQ6532122.1 hypothetical protein [Flavobacterium sp. LHD-85]
MNIGILTTADDKQRIALNWNFDVRKLIIDIVNDRNFVRFEIFDRDNNLVLTTYYPDAKKNVAFIKPLKVVKEVTGVPNDKIKMPFLRRKIYWRVDNIRFIKRKMAFSYVYTVNRKTELKIEWFVDRR